MTEFRIVLGSDEAYTKAKQALLILWNNRKTDELHTLEIKPYKKDRSTQANAYYWKCVVGPIAEHCGYTLGEAHNELLGNVFGWKEIQGLDGRGRSIPVRRTTDPEKMSVKEFANYIEQCQALAASLGVNLEPYSGNWHG